MPRAPAERSDMGIALEAAKSIPVNVSDLAWRLGVELRFRRMPSHISGSIERLEDGRFAITVNAVHRETRQRFTIAHELGHFILHRNRLGSGTNDTKKYRADPEARLYNDRIERRHETEANQFAASILMPEEMVIKFYKSFRPNDAEQMADFFGVSAEAMRYRLEDLRDSGKI